MSKFNSEMCTYFFPNRLSCTSFLGDSRVLNLKVHLIVFGEQGGSRDGRCLVSRKLLARRCQSFLIPVVFFSNFELTEK